MSKLIILNNQVGENNEFVERLRGLSSEDLIKSFNSDVRNMGWVGARGRFLVAMRLELQNRGFDCSEIIDKRSMSMAHKIKLENNKLVKID